MKTTTEQTQMVNELAATLQGIAWTRSQLRLQAVDFLKKCGVKRPSPKAIATLADGVADRLGELEQESR